MYEEVTPGPKDPLAKWLKEKKQLLILDEEVDGQLVRQVLECYGSDPDEKDLEKIGRDPFLIAYALRDPTKRTVVTTEVSKPSKQRANRHIPDVCQDLRIHCCNTFEFIKRLNFTTNWQKRGDVNGP